MAGYVNFDDGYEFKNDLIHDIARKKVQEKYN